MKTDWREPDGPTGGSAMPRLALPTMTPVTKRLLILNAVVFVVWLLAYWFLRGGYVEVVSNGVVERIYEKGFFENHLQPILSLNAESWIDWAPFVPIWQFLTYGFLHDPGSLMHLGGNMLVLYFFGTLLESTLGPRRFLITYLGAQLAGALLFMLPALVTRSDAYVVGASGAVYGLMIAVATMNPRQTVFLLFIPITMKVLAFGVLAITLFGVMSEIATGRGDGTAHLVHLGGIAYGFAAVKLGWIWRDPVQVVEAKRAIRTEERRVDDSREMDRLLDKIHREGMSALTGRERAFLKRVSKK